MTQQYLILFVLPNPDKAEAVLDAWEEADVPGITILPSIGLHSLRQMGLRDDLPLMPSLRDLYKQDEHANRTLFNVVRDEATVDRVIAATEAVVGKLGQPNTGLLVVMPVARVYGSRN